MAARVSLLCTACSRVNFINILCKAFMFVNLKSAKVTVKALVILRFWNLRIEKLGVSVLVKLTPDLLVTIRL